MESIQQGPHLVFLFNSCSEPHYSILQQDTETQDHHCTEEAKWLKLFFASQAHSFGGKKRRIRAEGNPVFPEVSSGNSNNH